MIPESELATKFPAIPWREPIPVTAMETGPTKFVRGFACRICIAQRGLKGKDVRILPKTRAEFDEHMAKEHP